MKSRFSAFRNLCVQSYQLCLRVFRYMSVVVLDEHPDCRLLALACSDGALRLVVSQGSVAFIAFVRWQ